MPRCDQTQKVDQTEKAMGPTIRVPVPAGTKERQTVGRSVMAPIPDGERTQVVPTLRHQPDGQTMRLSDADGPQEHPNIDPVDDSDLTGETFHTVFGNLLGIYKWEWDRVPSLDEIKEGMNRRVQSDCLRLRGRPRQTRLAGWHGGWTAEGVGIFAADIWGLPRRGPTRHLGHASVVVRTSADHGQSNPGPVAC
jgi:hypothetical protein